VLEDEESLLDSITRSVLPRSGETRGGHLFTSDRGLWAGAKGAERGSQTPESYLSIGRTGESQNRRGLFPPCSTTRVPVTYAYAVTGGPEGWEPIVLKINGKKGRSP